MKDKTPDANEILREHGVDGLRDRFDRAGIDNDEAQAILNERFTADSLSRMEFGSMNYIIPGFIAEGLTLFAGKPKIGKSWFLLHAAWAVSCGGRTLGGIHCEEGDVLYAALEDNKRRLFRRMKKLFADVPWPKRLTFMCSMPRLAQGGIKSIRKWIEKSARPRLIIIDTLAMVRMPNNKDQSTYDSDYAAVKELRDLAGERHVAIILVHHLRKAEADDRYDTVSGSLGLTGAPDTVMLIYRDTAGIVLTAKGRDVEEIEKAVEFDKATCLWTIKGDAAQVRQSIERTVIFKTLEEAGDEALGPQQIAAETGMKTGNIRRLLSKMAKDGTVTKAGYGKYQQASKAADQDNAGERSPR
jgi:RecA-family ATPase